MKSYDKNCFEFMENYLRVSFKYRKNPFEYENINEGKSSKKSSKILVSEEKILRICETEKTLKKIANYFGYKDIYKFKKNHLNNLIKEEKLKMTIPEQPRNRHQKYITSK